MSETPQTPRSEPAQPGAGRSSANLNADQMKAAVQGAHPYDLGIIGAGLLAFVFSLFSYYKATGHALGFTASTSESAWHGFFGWFAALVALAVSVMLAARLFGVRPLDAATTRLVSLIGYGVATLCVVLALFIIPGKVDVPGVDFGHGIGYWLSAIVIIAGLALSFLRKDADV